MVLLDSGILIEVTRERDEALLSRWRKLITSTETLAYSPVTAAELWAGRVRGNTRHSQLFGFLVCLSADGETGRIAGDLLRQYHGSHGLQMSDALSAATATQNDAQL